MLQVRVPVRVVCSTILHPACLKLSALHCHLCAGSPFAETEFVAAGWSTQSHSQGLRELPASRDPHFRQRRRQQLVLRGAGWRYPASCVALVGSGPVQPWRGLGLSAVHRWHWFPNQNPCKGQQLGQPATALEHQAHSCPGSAAAPAAHAQLLTSALKRCSPCNICAAAHSSSTLECFSPCRAGHAHTPSRGQRRGPATSWPAAGSQPSLRASLYIPAGHYMPSLYHVNSDAFTATTHMHSDNDRSARAALLLNSSLCRCCELSEAG